MIYSNILVAINIYEDYLKVLHKAEKLALKNNAHLTILMVTEEPIELISMPKDYQKQLMEEAKKTLTYEVGLLHMKEVSIEIKRGKADKVITQYAKSKKIQLIIIGSHTSIGINRILGSTANNILHKTPCDVLVINMNDRNPTYSDYKKVILACDQEENNKKMISTTRHIQDLYNSELFIINIYADPSIAASMYGVLPSQNEETVSLLRKRLINWTKENNLNATAICKPGIPANTINAYAKENQIELIIIGSHQRTSIGRFFLGSTANAILHITELDILTIKI
jgi:universal stress protein A